LWSRLGTPFGLGEADGNVDRRVAFLTLFLLVALTVVEMLTDVS
jgi:hypothetical protein